MRDDHHTEHRANDERHGPEEVPEPVYLLPVRDRGADATEEGADLEVPDDGAVGDVREEDLQEGDGDEEPAADDDGEDADDDAADEEQRRLARKQPGRERASPREIHHRTSPLPPATVTAFPLASSVFTLKTEVLPLPWNCADPPRRLERLIVKPPKAVTATKTRR